MFESSHDKEHRQRERLKVLLKGKTMIVADDDGARFDYADALMRLGAKEVRVARNGDEVLTLFREFSQQNRRVDMLITDLLFKEGLSGGKLIDGLHSHKFDEQVYTLDDKSHHVPYGRNMHVIVHSSGAERLRFGDGKNMTVAYRGHEDLLQAVGRALEKITPKEAASNPAHFAPPKLHPVTPKEAHKLSNPPVSKAEIFHARQKQVKDRENGGDSHGR